MSNPWELHELTIQVRKGQAHAFDKDTHCITLKCFTTGGPEGIRAIGLHKESGLVVEAAGDDGFWWTIATYHPGWLQNMISMYGYGLVWGKDKDVK